MATGRELLELARMGMTLSDDDEDAVEDSNFLRILAAGATFGGATEDEAVEALGAVLELDVPTNIGGDERGAFWEPLEDSTVDLDSLDEDEYWARNDVYEAVLERVEDELGVVDDYDPFEVDLEAFLRGLQ